VLVRWEIKNHLHPDDREHIQKAMNGSIENNAPYRIAL